MDYAAAAGIAEGFIKHRTDEQLGAAVRAFDQELQKRGWKPRIERNDSTLSGESICFTKEVTI